MLDCNFFYDEFLARGVGFWTGVPDSLLKNLCAYITDNAGCDNGDMRRICPQDAAPKTQAYREYVEYFGASTAGKDKHIIAVNEGAALGLAAGFYLATGKIPCVYMQNSGIGNAVNPLLSLFDKDVYRIPLLLISGWRGEPGVKDEPQHKAQGRVTPALFEAMDIPFAVLEADEESAWAQLDTAFAAIHKTSAPYALIVRKDTFANYTLKNKTAHKAEMTRESAIAAVLDASEKNTIIFCTTGMASRELYELREKRGEGHNHDFLTVGSMGHTASIALGFALQKPERRVICIDGDGAALMHLGAMAQIAARSPANFTHIILNNAAHDSVGGQPTIAGQVSLAEIARAAGYKRVTKTRTQAELQAALSGAVGGKDAAGIRQTRIAGLVEFAQQTPMWKSAKDGGFPHFVEVAVKRGARADLGRPTTSPEENKKTFMEAVDATR